MYFTTMWGNVYPRLMNNRDRARFPWGTAVIVLVSDNSMPGFFRLLFETRVTWTRLPCLMKMRRSFFAER